MGTFLEVREDGLILFNKWNIYGALRDLVPFV